MIVENCEEAKKHETLMAFADLATADLGDDGVLDFKSLKEPHYMKFWQYLSIMRLVNSDKDCEIIFWGTNLAENYGKELTGELMSVEEFGAAQGELVDQRFRVIKNKEISFISGTLDWKNRDYTKWYRLNLPLLKNDEICSLSITCFE